jgi:hypothetical protein
MWSSGYHVYLKSGDSGIVSWPRVQLYRSTVFAVFRGLSKEIPGEFIRLGDYRVLPYPFQFISHYITVILSMCIKMAIAIMLIAERDTV